jgi:hypothetical protein
VGEALAHLNHLVDAGLVRRARRDGAADVFVHVR